jgi:hypothetical protein
MLGKSVVVYLDNILVLSKTPAEHLVHLEQLFTLLQENKLFAKASKCTLNKDSTEYLEYLGKVATDCPAKLAAVSNWPRPENQSRPVPERLQRPRLLPYAPILRQKERKLWKMLIILTLGRKSTWRLFMPLSMGFTTRQRWCCPTLVSLPSFADACGLGTGALLQRDEHPNALLVA